MDTLVASHHVTTRIDRNVMSEFGNRLVRVKLVGRVVFGG